MCACCISTLLLLVKGSAAATRAQTRAHLRVAHLKHRGAVGALQHADLRLDVAQLLGAAAVQAQAV